MIRPLYIAIRKGIYSPDGTPEHSAQHTEILGIAATDDAAQALRQTPAGPGWGGYETEVQTVQFDDPVVDLDKQALASTSKSLETEWELSDVTSLMIDLAITQIIGTQPGDTSAVRKEIREQLYRDACAAVVERGGKVDLLEVK